MKRTTIVMLALLTGLVWLPAGAQDAASLQELLQRVQQGSASEQRELQQREAEFRQRRAEQQQLLQQARNERAAAERRSEQLETTFEANELRIAEQQQQLDERLGSLRELFGVLQQVASDTQGLLENSLTSVQPDIRQSNRVQFLGDLAQKMGTAARLASIEEMERLWFELQREMTLQGQNVTFPATVITSDGNQEEMTVARVGAFNIFTEGKFLQYEPETGNVSELPRQPDQARFTDTTEEVIEADPGELVTFALDPTRGQLLALLIESPTLMERIDQGGTVGYVIIALGLLGLLIAAERMVVLGMASRKVSAQLKSDTPRADNPLGRVLKVAEANKGKDIETLELKLNEAILQEQPALNRALLFLKIISVVAPLLGLLGTVTGMIVTFQAITLFGTGDPKLMAGGISQALVTTVQGLCVAIPMVLLHTLVSGRSRRIVHVLQEQAAGIIAERAERRG